MKSSSEILFLGDLAVDAVILHREAPVQIGVEQAGQNIEGGECTLYAVLVQKLHRVRERAAQAVGIGVEHGSIGKSLFHSCHLPAAISCLYSS